MSETKFCKDCKHFRRAWLFFIPITKYGTCHNPHIDKGIGDPKYYVTGKAEASFASAQRIHPCGSQARFFEPKE